MALLIKKKILINGYCLFLCVLLSSCKVKVVEDGEFTSGTFKTDDEMINIFINNQDDFNAIESEKISCNELTNDEKTEEYPIYCEEIKEKLSIVNIFYQEKFDSLSLVMFTKPYFVKGYWFSTDVLEEWEGNLDVIPKLGDENFERFIKIKNEQVEEGWYLYAFHTDS